MFGVRGRLGVVVVATAVALVVGACGDDSSSRSAAAGTTGGAGVSSATSGAGSVTTVAAVSVLGSPKAASGEPLRVGFVSDGTAQTYDNTEEITAAQAAAKYANEYLGGAGGRPIEVVTCEAHGTVQGSTDCANQMVEKKVAAVVMGGAAEAGTVHNFLVAAGIPFVIYQGSSQDILGNAKLTYNLTGGVTTLLSGPAAWAKSKGYKKVTFLDMDIPQVTGAVTGLGPKVFANAGVAMNQVAASPTAPDLTPQVQQAIAGNPDMLMMIGGSAFCTKALKAINTLGYKGDVMANQQCIGQDTLTQAPKAAVDGLLQTSTADVSATDPEFMLYKAVIDKYTSGVKDLYGESVAGYAAMLGFARMMQGATGTLDPAGVETHLKQGTPFLMPLGGGLKSACDSKAIAFLPATCTAGVYIASYGPDGTLGQATGIDTADLLKLG